MGKPDSQDKQKLIAYYQSIVDNSKMPFTRFTLRQLEAFVTVAELQSFSAASERLALTAQAVSRLIAELEGVVGFKLFERTTRRVRLSGAGREFLTSTETTLRHVRATEKTADDVRNRATGILRIGAPQVLASMVLPHAVKDYVQVHPKVVVRIVDVSVDALIDTVAGGDIDLGIGPDRLVPETLERQVLFNSPWVLWCPPSHWLAAKRSIKWSDLRDVPLVSAGNDHERSVAQMRVNLPDGLRITPLDIVDNVSTAMGISATGLAVTLAPAYVGVMARHFGLVKRRVLEPETVRQVCLYRNRKTRELPVAGGFADHLAIWMPQWHKRNTKRQSVE